eukprot:scaffold94781_cov61-Phaeocystis_antarctica.AAC.2
MPCIGRSVVVWVVVTGVVFLAATHSRVLFARRLSPIGGGCMHLGEHVLICRDRSVPGRAAIRRRALACLQALDHGVGVRPCEVDEREPASARRHVSRDAVPRAAPSIICPTLQQVADVDREGVGWRGDRGPLATRQLHLEPPPQLLAALQDSEAIEVRVRTVPQPLRAALRTLRTLRTALRILRALRALIARRVPSEPQQRARVQRVELHHHSVDAAEVGHCRRTEGGRGKPRLVAPRTLRLRSGDVPGWLLVGRQVERLDKITNLAVDAALLLLCGRQCKEGRALCTQGIDRRLRQQVLVAREIAEAGCAEGAVERLCDRGPLCRAAGAELAEVERVELHPPSAAGRAGAERERRKPTTIAKRKD